MTILWAWNAFPVFAKNAEFSLKWVQIISFIEIIGIQFMLMAAHLSKEDDFIWSVEQEAKMLFSPLLTGNIEKKFR